MKFDLHHCNFIENIDLNEIKSGGITCSLLSHLWNLCTLPTASFAHNDNSWIFFQQVDNMVTILKYNQYMMLNHIQQSLHSAWFFQVSTVKSINFIYDWGELSHCILVLKIYIFTYHHRCERKEKRKVWGKCYEVCSHECSSPDTLVFLSLQNTQTIEQTTAWTAVSSQVKAQGTWVEWGVLCGQRVVRARPNKHFQRAGPPSNADLISLPKGRTR